MHKVTCIYCKKQFDRDIVPYSQVSQRRYAHKECAIKEYNRKQQEDIDKTNLEKYILKLFNIDFLNPRIKKQISEYVNVYHYSYSSIQKALVYFFEIKGNSIEKANGGIGIVPYIYDEARNYFYILWLAEENNKDKNIIDYKPQVIEVKMQPPIKKVKRKRLFSFLDDEEVLSNGK